MKAIIPVAGAGTMLRPHTYTQPKTLIPVAGKPILGFIIEQLQEVGCDDFVFVIGYLGEKIRNFVDEKYPDINAQFAVQNKREGLGHAIWMAKEFVKDDEEILIILGDTIIETDLKTVVNSEVSMLGVKKVDDPRNFGVAEMDGEGNILKAVEKPRFPKSNQALVGVYRILESKALFAALDNIVSKKPETGTNGEIHLTDAIMQMIDQGISFKGFTVANWYDCGKVEILLETNATLLKKHGAHHKSYEGLENSIIIDPVSIAPGARIANSIIGPDVTIGENSEINHSIVKNSIIGSFARLEQVILHSSVIGSDAYIKGLSQSLNIGDNTEIDLSGDVNR